MGNNCAGWRRSLDPQALLYSDSTTGRRSLSWATSLFSVKPHLREAGVQMSSAYQPSTCTCMFPGSESQKVHLPVPLLLPAIPVPTPTLLGGLLSYSGGGGRDLPGHKLLAVLSQALRSSAESAPMPCPGAFLLLSLRCPRAQTVLRPSAWA